MMICKTAGKTIKIQLQLALYFWEWQENSIFSNISHARRQIKLDYTFWQESKALATIHFYRLNNWTN
jgi:hypothetical protein